MAFQSFANGYGTVIGPLPYLVSSPSITQNTMDATGESVGFIGNLYWADGASHVVSAGGGGSIAILVGNGATFANGVTVIGIGIQDVNGSTGIEDGAFDVQAVLVGGVDSLTINTVKRAVMTTGTKTIAHNALVAVVVEMTVRAGADSVTVRRMAITSALFPYCTSDVGAGPVITNSTPIVTVIADDGVVGVFGMDSWARFLDVSPTFGSSSTPDEYALVFSLPFSVVITALFAVVFTNIAAADDFELILYSNPLGTPVAERTITCDSTISAAATGAGEYPLSSPFTLAANTTYAIAIRPTTTGTITFQTVNFGSGNAALRGATMLGTNWSQYSRTDNTGAFGSENTTLLPQFGMRVSQLSDNAGGGGPVGRAVMVGPRAQY